MACQREDDGTKETVRRPDRIFSGDEEKSEGKFTVGVAYKSTKNLPINLDDPVISVEYSTLTNAPRPG